MRGLGFFVLGQLLQWLTLCVFGALLFVSLIFIRITVPRFRVETLSRLGWATLLSLLAAVWLAYAAGLVLG